MIGNPLLYDSGSTLLDILIEDQIARAELNAYNDSLKIMHPEISPFIFTQGFEAANKAILNKQFQVFQDSGRLFTQTEIGSMYRRQFLLFAHEVNKDRLAFYLKLIKQAVANKVCDTTTILNFVLRSECIEKGVAEFLRILDERAEQLKKEYHLKEYSYRVF